VRISVCARCSLKAIASKKDVKKVSGSIDTLREVRALAHAHASLQGARPLC
jgi:hypothetical protein